ncbi:hypothetical protein BN1708_000503 [Verticillium longisporum]|uniref:Uncharacterized protein n=1 Tax=Verticillium longisporum TaxID=100787 RepID=A0A0G4LCU0_VERLO|nr:hypothetical protein BN1708_000503 [Verticillium longisporum]
MPHTSATRWLSALRHPARRRPGLAGSQVSIGLPTLTFAALESRGFRAVMLVVRPATWSWQPTVSTNVLLFPYLGTKALDEGPTSDQKVGTLLCTPRPHAKAEADCKWALAPLAKPVTWQASTKSCLDGHRSSETPISIMRIVEFVLPHHERLVTTLLDQT